MQKALVAFLLLITPLQAGSLFKKSAPPPTSQEAQTMIQDQRAAAFFHFYLIKKDDNPLISPFAIQTSFLAAYMGAKGNTAKELATGFNFTLPRNQLGPTYSAIASYLSYPKKSSSNYLLRIGSAIWVSHLTPLIPSYRKLMEKDFATHVEEVDFSDPLNAINTINDWASEATDGKVEQFVTTREVTTATRMMLTNGLMVRGEWETPFSKEKTGSKPFLTNKNTSINTPTMHQVAEFPYFENEKTQVLALPLKNHADKAQLALVIFLPKESLLTKVFDYYYTLQQRTPDGFLELINNLKPTYVSLDLPKFTFNKRALLKDFYQSIGVQEPFTPQANFSGIDGKQDLYISNALHESFISVDEGGIFATAASGISFNLKSEALEPPVIFQANHPFFYCIMDLRAKLILFMGILNNPSVPGSEAKKQ